MSEHDIPLLERLRRHLGTAHENESEAAAEIERLGAALAAAHDSLIDFVGYYDQAGIGECTEADEDDPPDGFDGDEIFNVRKARKLLEEKP